MCWPDSREGNQPIYLEAVPQDAATAPSMGKSHDSVLGRFDEAGYLLLDNIKF